jgi:FkbM family methyltransferase
MNNLKRRLISISNLLTFFYPRSFSQEGEDMIMKEIFFKQKKGFYVDIGAHHPKRFSNSYHYYKIGWRGINIDAMPGSMKLFKLFRHKDINIEVGIADKEGELTFYVFNEPALNTFSKEIGEADNGKYKLIDRIPVKVFPLDKILDRFAIPRIDFMNIDVEGMDLMVLKSNNWEKYQPKMILVEAMVERNGMPDEITSFLNSKGYKFYACTRRTSFFIRN